MTKNKRVQFLEELLEDVFSQETIESIPEENREQVEIYRKYLKELIEDLKGELEV